MEFMATLGVTALLAALFLKKSNRNFGDTKVSNFNFIRAKEREITRFSEPFSKER